MITWLVMISLKCISSVQFSSVAQLCPTLCDPMNCSTPGLPVHHQLPEFTQTQRPSSQWCHPAISSSVVLFSSYPHSLPASESFPMSQLFAWEMINYPPTTKIIILVTLASWGNIEGWMSWNCREESFLGQLSWLPFSSREGAGQSWTQSEDWTWPKPTAPARERGSWGAQ